VSRTEDRADPASRELRPGLLLLACCLALFVTSLDSTIVNVALPTLSRDLHASTSGLQWIIDSYTVVAASLLILAGSIGDRIGRRTMFQVGLVIFGAGSLACSLAPSTGWLIGFRMAQAVGASMLQPNALSTLTNVITEPAARARAIGVWGGVFGAAAASGPILGGVLVDTVGWRSIFWVNLPIVALAVVLLARYAPDTRAAWPRPVDGPGQVLILVTLAAVTSAVIEGPTWGWGSLRVVGLAVVGVAALTTFLVVESHRAQPLLELRFFRSPPFSGASSIAVLAFIILAGFLFLNTLYLQQVRGDSALMAGVATLPATIVIAFGSPLTGRLVARSGSRLPLAASGVLLAGGAAVLTLERTDTSYLVLAVGYLGLGLGFALVNPPITNTAVSGMPRAQAGVASAVASTSRQVGNALGVAVIGSVVTSRFRVLASSIATTDRLPAATAQRLSRLSFGDLGAAGDGAGRAVVRSAFATAGHAGWWIAVGAGVLVTVVGAVTAGPRGRARADAVMADFGE
jgi:EmrB/QacA subfamily drug resistance transporter